jgi:hypothetical protein
MKFRLDPNKFDACTQFNDWVDEQYSAQTGALDILGFQPRPSEVLFRLSRDTYEAAFADFLEERDEQLKQLVIEKFPAPIAHYFYRFQTGYENELQRLHFLRDTWEATVDVLHAMAVGECRFRGIAPGPPVRFDDLLTDRVATRLLTIERLINAATKKNVSLAVSKIASLPVLEVMSELNRSRNAFSHSAAQSESQARTWVGECQEDLLGVLDDLRALADCSILRYLGQIDGVTLKTEAFCGHGSTRTIKPLALNADQVRDSGRYFRLGEVLSFHDGCLFSLRPLIYYKEDASGHFTRLCMFRKTRGDIPNRRVEFEIVGESNRWDEDREIFQAEMSELRALFSLPPE